MEPSARGSSLGHIGNQEERHASWLELFFDLVFVLAVTQVADSLEHDLSPAGFLHFALVFLPLWWGWVGFSFYISRFPREDSLVRLLMLAAMLAVAALSTNVDGAFTGETAVGFALSYAALRACLVALYVNARSREPAARELVDFYIAGFGLGVVLWLISAGVPEPARYVLWAVGFAVEAGTPALAGGRMKRAPGIDLSHLPERFGLFVIIVLGESVAVVGLGLADIEWTVTITLSAVGCFVLAAAVWWEYFDYGARSARLGLMSSAHPAAYARDVYSYGHLPVVLGIAAASVGAEYVIAHSGDAALSAEVRWALAGGVAIYLLGNAGMHVAMARTTGDPGPRVGIATVVLMLALAAVSGSFAPLLFLALIVALVVGQLALELQGERSADRRPRDLPLNAPQR
jgi:low temperature requirement protein LtrA